MKRIVLQITDTTIKYDVEDALKEMEDNDEIEFPTIETRDEFITECVENIIERYEFYDYEFTPDYDEIVYELAAEYEYTK